MRVCDEGDGWGRENGSKVDEMEISDGFREANRRDGVGVMEGCSEKSSPVVASAGDSGTISVTTCKKSDEDCVASSCDTDKVTSEG